MPWRRGPSRWGRWWCQPDLPRYAVTLKINMLRQFSSTGSSFTALWFPLQCNVGTSEIGDVALSLDRSPFGAVLDFMVDFEWREYLWLEHRLVSGEAITDLPARATLLLQRR